MMSSTIITGNWVYIEGYNDLQITTNMLLLRGNINAGGARVSLHER